MLAAGTFAGRVHVWDLAHSTMATNFPLQHENPIYSIAWSPDGRTLAAGDSKGTVVLFDPASGKPLRTFDLVKRARLVQALAFSPDGKLLAGGGDTVVVLRLDSTEPLGAVEMRAEALTFSTDGRRLAIGTLQGHLAIVDVFSGKRADWIGAPEVVLGTRIDRAIYRLSFRPNGRILAATHFGIVEFEQGPNIKTVGEPFVDSSVAQQMATGLDLVAGLAQDGASPSRVRLWDADTRRAFPAVIGSESDSEITQLAMTSDGKRLAIARRSGNVEVVDTDVFGWARRVIRHVGVLPTRGDRF
jgi:WD40 repeat protein